MKNLNGSVVTWLSRKASGLMSASPANVRWGGGGGSGGGLLKQFPGAAAGYSLRQIGSGPVVRLRRGSDSAESDFGSSDLTGSVAGAELIAEPNFGSSTGWNAGSGWVISGGTATLTSTSGNNFLSSATFLNHDYYLVTITIDSCSDFGQVGMRMASNNYRPFSDFGITTAGTYMFLVDRAYNNLSGLVRFFEQGTEGVVAVLSQCSVKPYTPSPAELWSMNVTNSFYPWRVDGSYDSYVTTWYDQGEGGRDVSQSTASLQPLLVHAGYVNTDPDSGLPAIKWSEAVGTYLVSGAGWSDIPQPTSQFSVARLASSSATHCIASGTDSSKRQHLSYSNTSGNFAMFGGVSLTSSLPGDLNNHVYSGLFSGAGSVMALDGAVIATGDSGSNSIGDRLVMGAQQDGSVTNWDGNIQEFVIYPSDQSANRTGIETNINDHYGVY